MFMQYCFIRDGNVRTSHGTEVSYWEEATMTALILVAYVTQHGSTQEVAEAITATLREHGLEVEMRPAWEVHTLGGYSAVVLGAPLYLGCWHRDARRFLMRHRVALSERPVAIFALGPLSTAEEEWRGSREQLDSTLTKVSWLAPVAVEVFGGAIDPAKVRFPFNKMPASDARDWTAIRAFANRLATMLRPTALSPSEAVPRPESLIG
jgi:menaquinone-dependent protoporphyrinogen oxidase